VPRLDTALVRSAIALAIWFIAVAVVLWSLYSNSQFGEGTERWLIAGLLVVSAAALWLALPSACTIIEVIVTPVRRFGLLAVFAFALLAMTSFIIVAKFVLDAFPNSGDEVAYIMQAQTYAQGRLWVVTPPLIDAFRQYRFFDVGDKWVSQYAPGWAMMLTPMTVLDLPLWIVNPAIGGSTLIAFFGLARRVVSNESAWIGILLLGASSFFSLNSGSYFPHNVTALYGVAFALSGTRYIARGEAWSALAAGVFIGLIALTRTQNALIFALPFVIALAVTPRRRIGLFWFGLGGIPFFIALLAYNSAITGHAFLPVARVHGKEQLGVPTALSIRLTARRFGDLFVWTAPCLAVGYFPALAAVVWRGRSIFTDWIMPATVVFFLLYSGVGGDEYGPRYYFEAWPFAILTILKAIDPIVLVKERPARAAWVCSALVTSLMFEFSYLPAHFEREHRVVLERQDVYKQVERAGLNNAVVIIASKVGSIRKMAPEDLLRNGFVVTDRNVIYANNLDAKNNLLRSQFPERSFYIYSNGRLELLH